MALGIKDGRQVLDLGNIDAPLLVFGGPYSNLEATTAMLAIANDLGIPAERTICTGDVVAYCADAQACVDAIRAADVHVVMGNCEESLGQDGDDCGCGFEEGSACDVASRQWFAYATAQMTVDARIWMGNLPERIRLRMAGRRLCVIHGGVNEINRFIFASTPAGDKLAELAAANADGIIAGHCGIPFSDVIDGRLWHNAGVIGMPANDGTPRAWYSILRPEGDGIRISHHVFDYDHRAAAEKMYAHGLPAGYAEALGSGLWPSLDVLPAAEHAATGQALALGELMWTGATARAAAGA